MSCGHCVKAVDSVFKSFKGIKKADVTLGKAEAEFDDDFNFDDLYRKLADAGYPAKQ